MLYWKSILEVVQFQKKQFVIWKRQLLRDMAAVSWDCRISGSFPWTPAYNEMVNNSINTGR